MTGKVIIDIKQRTVGRLGLLWNRSTPTRGTKATINFLAGSASQGSVHVIVDRQGLVLDHGTKQLLLPSSGAYAHSLFKAGVTELTLPSGLKAAELKSSLDIITGRAIGRAEKALQNGAITLEIKRGDALTGQMPITWNNFYDRVGRGRYHLPFNLGAWSALAGGISVGIWGLVDVSIGWGSGLTAALLFGLAGYGLEQLICRTRNTADTKQLFSALENYIQSTQPEEEVAKAARDLKTIAGSFSFDRFPLEYLLALPAKNRDLLVNQLKTDKLNIFDDLLKVLAPDNSPKTVAQYIFNQVSQSGYSSEQVGSYTTAKNYIEYERGIFETHRWYTAEDLALAAKLINYFHREMRQGILAELAEIEQIRNPEHKLSALLRPYIAGGVSVQLLSDDQNVLALSPLAISGFLNEYVPKSVPEIPAEYGSEWVSGSGSGGDCADAMVRDAYGSEQPVLVRPSVPAHYSLQDFQLAVDIINRYPSNKQEAIIASLNSELRLGVSDLMNSGLSPNQVVKIIKPT